MKQRSGLEWGVIIFMAILGLLAAHAVFPATFDARVIDGDTVNVPIGKVHDMPKRVSIRLIGINAPETHGACPKETEMAAAAKLYVRDVFDKSKRVRVQYVRWDKYGGRVAGRVTVDGKDLSKMIMDAGFAVPYLGGKRVNVWCAAP